MLINKNELKNNTVYEVYKKNGVKKVFIYWFFENALSDKKDWVFVNFSKNERTHYSSKKVITDMLKSDMEKENLVYHIKKKTFE